jgi:Ras-related protein Rab-11A
MTSAYYRGALGALLVYDITREDSFFNLENWRKELMEHAESDLTIMVNILPFLQKGRW